MLTADERIRRAQVLLMSVYRRIYSRVNGKVYAWGVVEFRSDNTISLVCFNTADRVDRYILWRERQVALRN